MAPERLAGVVSLVAGRAANGKQVAVGRRELSASGSRHWSARFTWSIT